MEDIETILNTLIYDGKVEMTIIAAKEGTVGSVDGHMKLYRAVNPIIPPTGLVRAPCGLCPVSYNGFPLHLTATECRCHIMYIKHTLVFLNSGLTKNCGSLHVTLMTEL